MIRAGGEVARLIDELQTADTVRREAAVARLRVIGMRAVDALTALAHSHASPETRAAALHALEGIEDRRAVDAALPLIAGIDTDTRVFSAAVAVLRPWVARESGTRVLDALTTVALDSARDAAQRLSALDAIGQLPPQLVSPVFERAALGPPGAPDGDDPLTVLEWLASADEAPLSEIHALIVRVRDLERDETSSVRREQWTRARGVAHALLARRGSRVALYDLREAFDAAITPLPPDYLAAIVAIGDASCLEPMARAWGATGSEDWWRERLTEAATDIVRRSGLSGRNSAVKRIRTRWPGFI